MAAAGDRTQSAMVLMATLVTLLTLKLVSPQETTELNLTQDNLYMRCRSDRGIAYCMRHTQCAANLTILHGGDIFIVDVRELQPIVVEHCGNDLWCCSDDLMQLGTPGMNSTQPPTSATVTVTPLTSTVVAGSCLRSFDECTWCVSLYREGGDISRAQRTSSGLYCGGALIGPRVVLTAATCVRTVQKEKVRVRAPFSANPTKYYDVVRSVSHPKYSSSTHANDFALMLLNEDVDWDNNRNNGACLNLQTPMSGECQVVGFTKSEEIVLTPVSVADGACGRKVRTPEWSCGTAKSEECNASPGSPVLCPITSDEQGGMEIAGVSRLHCLGDSVLLGKLQPHADWLQQQLNILGVNSSFYSS